MKQDEKSFEVILAPVDMLEKELEGVLGGVCTTNNCGHNDGNCMENYCSCNSEDCATNNCGTNRICPPGFVLVGCDCMPIDMIEG